MVRLELRHYRAVLALRHHRTVTAAAAALGLSQSAISHQLAEAERRLGRKLTVRSGRKLWLNTAGELLASSAEIILNEANHVETHLISGSERTETRILRIATFAYNSYRWLPEFLKIEKKKRPNVNFEFVASAPGLPVRAIENGEADLGVIAGQIKSRHVVAVPLFDDELVCVCPKNHPLAARLFLEADDFVDYPFITYSAHFESGFEEDQLWRPSAKRPKLMLSAGYTEAVIELVRAEFGLSILSRWAIAQYHAQDDIEQIRVTPNGLPLSWHAVYHRAHLDRYILAELSHSLRDWCQNSALVRNSP